MMDFGKAGLATKLSHAWWHPEEEGSCLDLLEFWSPKKIAGFGSLDHFGANKHRPPRQGWVCWSKLYVVFAAQNSDSRSQVHGKGQLGIALKGSCRERVDSALKAWGTAGAKGQQPVRHASLAC